MPHCQRIFSALAVGLGALVAGCGDSGATPATHPVSGKVLLASGKPLGSGTIVFEPVSAPGLKASGKLQPDGSFTLATEGGAGAAEGENRVYVVPDGEAAVKKAGAVPPAFRDPDSSGLSVTVKAGTNQLDPIVLKPKLAARTSR